MTGNPVFGIGPSRRPVQAPSLPHVLQERAATETGTAFRFLVDGTGATAVDRSYRDLAADAGRAAVSVAERGLGGTRVVLALEPGLDYVAALFGIMQAGATAVPTFAPGSARARDRIAAIAKDCRPAALVVEDRAAERVRALISAGQIPPAAVVTAAELFTPPEPGQGIAIAPGVPALLQYTSGSTGRPRGVVLSHRNLLSNSHTLIDRMGVEPDRVGCTWLPPYHDMGLLGTLILSVYGGWPLVMLTPAHFLQDPARWLRAMSDHRVTVTVAPNFALGLCAELPEEALTGLDLSRLRQVYCGAEPVLAATARDFHERLAPHGLPAGAVAPCYGLAEATLFVAGKPRATAPVIRSLDGAALQLGRAREPEGTTAAPGAVAEVVSCGPPAADHDVVIVDPDTRLPVPPETVGEIWVHGPNVAQGYFSAGGPDGESASSAVFHVRLATDSDTDTDTDTDRTYLRTGDLGFLWAGELFVTGRHKEVIVIAGRNLHPGDIERSALRGDAEIRQAAAFAVGPGPAGTARLVVAAELRRRTAPAPAAAAELRRRIVACVVRDHGVAPDDVRLGPVGMIETTTSGKVRRLAAREAYLAGTLKSLRTGTRAENGVPA